MSPRALSAAVAAAAAIVLLGAPAGAVDRGDVAPAPTTSGGRAGLAAGDPVQTLGSFDNVYAIDAGGSVTDSLGALGADDLLVYSALTVGPLDAAGAGTLTVSGTYPSGTFTFTAAEGFSGRATAGYVGETADGERLTAAVVFDVADAEPPNHPPVARLDVIIVAAGGTASVSPLANDTDPDTGDLLTLVGVSPASLQDVTVETAGTTIRARASAGAAPGTRRFTYTIADRAGATATGSLRVTVRSRSTTSTTSTTRPASPSTPATTSGRPPVGATTVPVSRNGPDPLPAVTTTTADGPADATTTSAADAKGEVRTTVLAGGAGTGTGDGSTSTSTAASAGAGTDPTTNGPKGSTHPVAAGIVLGCLGISFVALAGRRRLRHPHNTST